MAIHGDRYLYDKAIYTGSRAYIEIGCKKHGYFMQWADSHIRGVNCKDCSDEEAKERAEARKMTKEAFLKRSIDNHGEKYDYSLIDFGSTFSYETKVEIICPEHGIFPKKAGVHASGTGCPKCSYIETGNKLRSNKQEFIKKSQKIHGELYDYSLVNYVRECDRVEIICKKHKKSFFQTPNAHYVQKQGCPNCNNSKGEQEVFMCLKRNKINFRREATFDWARSDKGNRYKYDFFVPDHGCVIEFHGQQHYEECTGYYTGKLKERQYNDRIKKELAELAGLIYVEIPYNKNVNKTIKEHLGINI